jgi:glycine hydroxymethyltransferase
MAEGQMREVADLIARVAVKGEAPEAVAEDVASLRKEFNTIHYCFTPGVEAHRRWRIT